MNLATLIKQYFSSVSNDITIDVFDEKNIYDVYQRVVGLLTMHIDIETTVLQAMSYCFYEILDNVLTHSGKDLGTVLTHYDSNNHILSFLVADNGIGVQASLSENEEYAKISEPEALRICIKDAITDGKGMGLVCTLHHCLHEMRDWCLRCVPANTQCKYKKVLKPPKTAIFGKEQLYISNFTPTRRLTLQRWLPTVLMWKRSITKHS